MRLRTAATAVLVSAVAGCGAGDEAPAGRAGASPPPAFRPFAPDSIWNLPLRRDVPLDPRSGRYVGALAAMVREHGAYINDSSCPMPTYWATARTERVPVTLDHAYRDGALLRAWRGVPIPEGATPANCSDANMAVALRRRDGRISVWEFWVARRKGGRWQANWGGYTDDVRADRGSASWMSWQSTAGGRAVHSDTKWHVTGSSISMVAGVITQQDLARGRIDHALAMATTETAARRWFFPAQRSDGGDKRPYAIPEGAHLRLDPDLDLGKLELTPAVRMIAEAAQRYGIVVRDRTHDVNVFYTDRQPGRPSRLTRLLDGEGSQRALEAFPWDRLQLVAAQSCTSWGNCRVTPKAVISVDPAAPRAGRPLVLDTSNSQLNHPRTKVAWDLDGDGAYETDGGRGVKLRVARPKAGTRKVGVRITTRDGITTTGTRAVTVRPSG